MRKLNKYAEDDYKFETEYTNEMYAKYQNKDEYQKSLKKFTEEQKRVLKRELNEEEYKEALGRWFPDYYEWCEYTCTNPEMMNDYYMKPGIMIQAAHNEGYLSEEMQKKWDYLVGEIDDIKMSYDDFMTLKKGSMIYGTMIGDIAGSRFEFNNYRKKDFVIFDKDSFFTDDTIMTIAVAKALKESKKNDYKDLSEKAIYYMQTIGRNYPDAGYGGNFYHWIFDEAKPYNSFGNGAAMRVGPCGFMAESLDEAKALSKAVTEISHNHPEGIKGAEAVAVAIYMSKNGFSKEEIKEEMSKYYKLDFTIDEIRQTYKFNETCQDSVPQAIEAFLESKDFEDAIRTAISLGGDSDTIGAITGSIAEAYYGVPEEMKVEALKYLSVRLKKIAVEIERQ
jgi:ADP-ribosyl-[dinitrogen reductase] hydrolase